jgi:1,4-dihydroxy-2-naphthoate octaprenyltransferase
LALSGSTGLEVLLCLLSLPLALKTERAVSATEGRALNPLLAATAKLLAIFGILFALGLGWRGALSNFGLASRP